MKKIICVLAFILFSSSPVWAVNWYWVGSTDKIGYFIELDSMGFALHPDEKIHTEPVPFNAQQAEAEYVKTMWKRGFSGFAIDERVRVLRPEWQQKEEAYRIAMAQKSSYQYIVCWVKQEYPNINETKLYKNIYDVKGARWYTATIVSYKNRQQTSIMNISNPTWNSVIPGSYDEKIYGLCQAYYRSIYRS